LIFFFEMPMPDGPVVFVGEGSQFPAGIDGVSVANSRQKVAIQQTVSVRVTVAQIEVAPFGEHFNGADFCGTVYAFSGKVAGPPAAYLRERSGADVKLTSNAAQFQFALKSQCGELREFSQCTADKNNLMALVGVPERAGNPLFEEID
jgi:hypothetical protein